MYVCMYVCMYVDLKFMYVCVYVDLKCMYVCMYVCTVRNFLCMYVCMYVCMYSSLVWEVNNIVYNLNIRSDETPVHSSGDRSPALSLVFG